VAHLYVVRVNGRDALRDYLKSFGISTDIHYPIPDHRQPVFAGRYAQIQLPNTERLATEILTLPLYPEMSDSQVDEVINAVNQW
jgi:dTDP-4-amino-4,6-dideoxygalactose transaminase